MKQREGGKKWNDIDRQFVINRSFFKYFKRDRNLKGFIFIYSTLKALQENETNENDGIDPNEKPTS